MNASKKQYKAVAALLLFLSFSVACQRSPLARRDRFIAAGKKLVDKKDYARAIIEFRNAIVAMPRDAEAYYQLGMAYLAASDFRHGYASLKQATELNPSYAQAQLKLAQLQSATGDRDMMKDAAQRLESLLSKSGADADTLNTLAYTEIQLGNVAAATRHLEKILSVYPKQLISTVLLANAKLAENDPKAAEEALKTACANDPKSADAAVMLGKFYVSRNRGTEAEQQFQRALELNPRDTTALSSLGLLQYNGGHKQEAEQTFRQLAGGSDSSTNFAYGLFLFQENRRDEAVREFERLAKQNPDDRDDRTRLVAAYLRVGRTQDAVGVLAKALKKNSRDTSALLQRGEIYLRDKKYGLAEEDFNKVVKLTPDSPEIHYLLAKLNQGRGSTLIYRQELSEALRANPALLVVRLELAQNLLQSNGAKSALEVLDEAPGRQKEMESVQVARNWAFWALGDMSEMRKGIDQGLAKERSADLLIQDGLWKLRAGNPTGARASLDEALKINPSDLQALQALTQTYAAQKNPATAIEKVKEYAARKPNVAPVQEFLGEMLTANGDRAGAREAFQAAKAADPQFVEADLSLVQIYAADGNLDAAQKALEGVISSKSGRPLAHLWLGNIAVMKGDRKAAMEQFQYVVRANPENAQALNNLAYMLNENGDPSDEALKYAQKAVELDPGHAAYSDTLGWILYRRGLYTSAIKYLETANAQKSDVVWSYHLAMAYAKGGDSGRGRSILQAALKQNPSVPEAAAAREVIEGHR